MRKLNIEIMIEQLMRIHGTIKVYEIKLGLMSPSRMLLSDNKRRFQHDRGIYFKVLDRLRLRYNRTLKLMRLTNECEVCEGKGKVLELSCCGCNMENNDINICPDCKENWCSEMEECEECNGTGQLEIK